MLSVAAVDGDGMAITAHGWNSEINRDSLCIKLIISGYITIGRLIFIRARIFLC